MMLANCAGDKEAAKAKLSYVPELIEHGYCVCGEAHENSRGKFWLQCNGCDDWYHVLGSCDGVPFATEEDAKKSSDEWYCSGTSEKCDRAIRLADALRRKSVKSGHSRFDWRGFGVQCGVCYKSVPANVSFLHGPLETRGLENTGDAGDSDDSESEAGNADDIELDNEGRVEAAETLVEVGGN